MLTHTLHDTSPATNIRYVKFEDADWKLEGANEPGLYPVLPNSRTWKLDKGRKHAVLKVSRKQIPLTPAFAITAHASQGKTLPPGRTQNATCSRRHNAADAHAANEPSPGTHDCICKR